MSGSGGSCIKKFFLQFKCEEQMVFLKKCVYETVVLNKFERIFFMGMK